MKIEFNREELVYALSWAHKIAKNNQVSVLKNIKVSVAKGYALVIGTNNDMYMELAINCASTEDTDFLIDPVLIDWFKKCKSENVLFNISDDKIFIKSGRAKRNVAKLDINGYPDKPELNNPKSIDFPMIWQTLKPSLRFIHTNSPDPTLQSVLVEVKENKLKILSSLEDMHYRKLSDVQMSDYNLLEGQSFKVLIHNDALLLLNLFENNAEISKDDLFVSISDGNSEIIFYQNGNPQTLEGYESRFTDRNALIRETTPDSRKDAIRYEQWTHKPEFEPDTLKSFLAPLELLARDASQRVHVNINDDKFSAHTVSNSYGKAEFEMTLAEPIDGSLGLSISYLHLDAICKTANLPVALNMEDAHHPIKAVEYGDDYISEWFFMPMVGSGHGQ